MTDRQKIVNYFFENQIDYKTLHRGTGERRQIGIEVGVNKLFFNEDEEIIEVIK